MENISVYLDDDSIEQIVAVYAGKGYDADTIRKYLRYRNIRVAFHIEISKATIREQGRIHTTRLAMSWNGSLRGSSVAFTN